MAFCGISHETNTFATAALGLTEIGPGGFTPVRGNDVVSTREGYLAGMLNAATELGYEKVGLLFADTEPSGTIADLAYESMRDEIIERLEDAMPVSAVAVENHGAGVAESYECIEGDLAKRIRAVVGPHVPIVGTFDLHGNISPECVAQYDFMCPVHLYPHTDSYERGVEAMRMVPRLLNGLKTTTHLEQVPTLLPLCMMCTQDGFPAAQMNDFMYSLEARPGVLDVTGVLSSTIRRVEYLGCLMSARACVASSVPWISVGRYFYRRLFGGRHYRERYGTRQVNWQRSWFLDLGSQALVQARNICRWTSDLPSDRCMLWDLVHTSHGIWFSWWLV